MQIINKVEINYFRSVYSATLKENSDINILTGSNDAGKSNVLKALNIFFNNETEPHKEFDFLTDLNRDRELEARAAKGRMTIWIKITFNNFLKWKSLPDKFSIKRTWNRYDSSPVDTVDEDIPATTLGRFLTKLQFHYVPAIRSREIFSDLLADLHDTLMQDESAGLRNSSDALVTDLQKLTTQMSKSILTHVKLDSRIDLPESLQDLFRALNFLTKFGSHEIPLILRGDGIQSRHLPFILAYIAEKSNKYHIWGYEEPENSLELSKAFEMAADFKNQFSQNNQIFLTTHSPAFYDLSGDTVAKWHVESLTKDDFTSTALTPLTTTHDVDKTMGLLSVITPRLKSVYEQTQVLQQQLSLMTQTLSESTSPVVYVEGVTDVEILRRAKEVLGYSKLDLKFEKANGAGDITQFLKVSTRVKADDRILIGLFDADSRGRREYETFKKYHILNPNTRIIDKGKKIYASILGTPEHLNAISEQFHKLDVKVPLCVEFMFAPEIIHEAITDKILLMSARNARIGNEELPLIINIEDIMRDKIDNNYIYLCNSIDDSCKTSFSDWVTKKGKEAFLPFRDTFENLAQIISAQG